jgi:hypothetical protein
MSFQTSQMDSEFGPSGERILSSSVKGQIFEFQNIVYILYTEYINQNYSIVLYEPSSENKNILYTFDSPIVIRTLSLDVIHRKLWFSGYVESPMRAFFAWSTITSTNTFSTISSLNIREEMKSIENLAVTNSTLTMFAGMSQMNECWITSNISSNIYKINTPLKNAIVKEFYLKNNIYHLFIEGIYISTNKNVIENYKIPSNTLIGSLL